MDTDSPEGWLASLGAAQPRYATMPTPGAKHELEPARKVAALLKRPHLPWQDFVTRVATEKLPDGSYRYQVVLITVPRQSGKTTILVGILTSRGIMFPGRRAFTTAQTGKDARERLFDLADALTASPLKNRVQVHRAAGSPRITLPTGSRISSFSPSPESLHGYTPDDVLLDEIFAFDDAEGSLLMGAITPAQQTVRDRQLLMCSTAGTADSTFLAAWIEKGRAATKDPDSRIAYFEWSLDDGLDPFDPANWDWHPGLAGGLITKADIAAAAETMTRSEFIRAFMNRPTLTKQDEVFNLKAWDAGKATLSDPVRSKVAVAWEVAYDRSRAAVVAAWRDGRDVHVKVLRNGSGTHWLPSALEEIYAANPLVVGADKYAQNNVILGELEVSIPDIDIKMLTPQGIQTGCAGFKARVEDKTIKHTGDTALQTAVAEAVSRPMGEGWALSHKSPPEVVAAVVAVRLLEDTKAEVQPSLHF